ncbi:F420-dependent glucose-6-phosphate dehydrogenase (fragment) [uncultured Stenotrophomonas sp.]|uniref:F420-dependent glucose-6-phosphate dehydrogenase n=1 Tax=uncultured Stenotrophomonas sp. TaxID=165438 RepID=A0A1Y5Q5L7_9GAMM
MADIIRAFRRAGGEGKPVFVQAKLSYARTDELAMREACEQWRTNALPRIASENLRSPAELERAAREVRVEDVARAVHVSADLERHVEWLRQYARLGVSRLYLHNVNREQSRFIRDFGKVVVDALGEGPE